MAATSGEEDVLANLALPLTAATITIRVIKSFVYRTEKGLVLHNVNLETTTVGDLKERVRQALSVSPGWKAYRKVDLDTLKLYTKAHGAKSQNLIINLENDEWILNNDSETLASLGFENETEVSFFNRVEYDAFGLNPETKWD